MGKDVDSRHAIRFAFCDYSKKIGLDRVLGSISL